MKAKYRLTAIIFFISIIPVVLLAGCSGKAKPNTLPQRTTVKPQTAAPAPAKPAADKSGQAGSTGLPDFHKDDINGDAGGNGQTDKDSASPFLEEALAATQEASADLDKGDVESALDKLDEAYSLLLEIDCSPDSPMAQDKSNLRILIAQKISQAYVRGKTPLVSVNNSIPLVENQWVQKEIKSFQTGERTFFIDAFKRSGLYRDMIISELKNAGLPEDLFWVPMIESWYKPRALSPARALGMWQFIRSTGYRYGLKQDKYVDERMDPLKSTRAAIRYLTELHGMFGDWTTALASYNCGEMYVLRAIRAQKADYLDNFWDVFNNLPYETARYVPRFIAAMLIMHDPAKYGFELPQPDPPVSCESFTMNSPVKLSAVSQKLGLDPVILVGLNPELRHDSTPNYAYDLRVPVGYAAKCSETIASLPTYVPPDVVFQGWYVVRQGDTLGAIARRYRTSVPAIVRLNNLKSSTMIHIGDKLRIPGMPTSDDGSATAAPVAAAAKPQASQAAPQTQTAMAATPGETVTYIVVQGDTLFDIARRYKTTVDKIKTENSLASDILDVGQKLTIRVGGASSRI